MKLEEIIRQFREDSNLTMQEFAERCNLSKGYVSMLEKGKHPQSQRRLVPSIDTYAKIANGMQISLDDLFLRLDDNALVSLRRDPIPDNIIPIPRMRTVPLLGMIACGDPILAAENIEGEVSAPEHVVADFALRCKGDSMINARIYDGDIVYIRQQARVDNGQIAAVLIGDEATLKRVYFYPESNKLVLNPENPAYEPLIFVGDELATVRILGRAVAFTSAVR